MGEEKANLTAQLRAEVEKKIPSAFTTYQREYRGDLPTGVSAIDSLVQGVPLHGLTEICGSSYATSGINSVFVSLLAQVSQDHCCALVDASDSLHPETAHAAGIYFPRLLWVSALGTPSRPNYRFVVPSGTRVRIRRGERAEAENATEFSMKILP